MTDRAQRLSLIFSCIGHTYVHLFTAFYFVIVLAVETAWGLPYYELIKLWTLGALLVGLGALPAGWLGDRIGAGRMMVIFYLGMGGSAVACAFADTPDGLLLGLAGIGLFASIYHPVGIAWLVRNSGANRGKLLGLNGIFGSVGVAAAGLTAGALIDLADWRAAFLVPGMFSVVTGVALAICLRRGWVRDGVATKPDQAGSSRADMVRVFAVLLVTMFLGAIVFQSLQAALPKVFAVRLADLTGEGAFGVGLVVAAVYGAAGLMQVVGGHLADKYPLKPVYLGAFLLQVPLLIYAAGGGGFALIAAALLIVMFGVGGLPAENMLLARYAPEKHHGLAFGAKFVLYFGSGPLALLFVARINEASGGFYWIFAGLAAMVAICVLVVLLLPGGGSGRTVLANPAE